MTYITHEIEVAYEALYADELIESVVLKVGDEEHYLTLDEAYKLGKILCAPCRHECRAYTMNGGPAR